MKFSAWYAILVGFLMIAQWIVSILSGGVPEFKTEPWRIGFHLAAEMSTALMLIVGGIAALRSSVWAKQILSVGLGMVIYSEIVSPGYFDLLGIRVLRGRIQDVAVDLRRGSPTYGRHVSILLDARDSTQIMVPTGFAHGFCTLEAETEVLYQLTDYYSPEHESGILWNDAGLAIPWAVTEEEAILSDRDRALPRFDDVVPLGVEAFRRCSAERYRATSARTARAPCLRSTGATRSGADR